MTMEILLVLNVYISVNYVMTELLVNNVEEIENCQIVYVLKLICMMIMFQKIAYFVNFNVVLVIKMDA